MRTLNGFLESNVQREWITFGAQESEATCKIYMRKSQRLLNHNLTSCLDIVSVETEKSYRGQGIFTKFMTELLSKTLAQFDFIYIENVMEKRFQNWFIKNDWKPYLPGGILKQIEVDFHENRRITLDRYYDTDTCFYQLLPSYHLKHYKRA